MPMNPESGEGALQLPGLGVSKWGHTALFPRRLGVTGPRQTEMGLWWHKDLLWNHREREETMRAEREAEEANANREASAGIMCMQSALEAHHHPRREAPHRVPGSRRHHQTPTGHPNRGTHQSERRGGRGRAQGAAMAITDGAERRSRWGRTSTGPSPPFSESGPPAEWTKGTTPASPTGT